VTNTLWDQVSALDVFLRRPLEAGVHNLYTVADRIPFIFVNYGRQWVQTFSKFFCNASVLLPHTEPSLLPKVSVWLTFYLASYLNTTDKEFFISAQPPYPTF